VEASDATFGVTVASARFMKPLDVDLVQELACEHSVFITTEEGSIGGFGDHVYRCTLEGTVLVLRKTNTG